MKYLVNIIIAVATFLTRQTVSIRSYMHYIPVSDYYKILVTAVYRRVRLYLLNLGQYLLNLDLHVHVH